VSLYHVHVKFCLVKWKHRQIYVCLQMSCCAVNAVTGTTNDFDTSAWITSGAAGSKQIPTFCCSGVTESTFSTHSDTACTDSVTSGYYTTVRIHNIFEVFFSITCTCTTLFKNNIIITTFLYIFQWITDHLSCMGNFA
jgi:hypothetical protein